MSKIGKQSISLPVGVKAALSGQTLVLEKAGRSFEVFVPSDLKVVFSGQTLFFQPADTAVFSKSLWGTVRSLVASKVRGLEKPFETVLDLVGVGYKASVQGSSLVMSLGYSHDITYAVPAGVTVRCEKPVQLLVSSDDKALLGRVVSEIVNFRPPEPYKGKGILVSGRFVFRKEGKKK